MALGGVVELFFGVKAEGQSLESIAKPLAAEEAEALMPLPLVPEMPRDPEIYHERHEALRAREQAEGERAIAAERRAELQELSGGGGGNGAAAERVRPEQVGAELAELRAQALDELAVAHEERARALQEKSPAERRVALARAAAAEQRARTYQERAAAMAPGDENGPEAHATLAEAAGERAREQEQLALAEEARAEAERLSGAAAALARARAEMHERWAAVHSARAAALEARARHDEEQAARNEAEARDRELIARAAELRVDAAEHRARIEALQAEDAGLSQAEREERIRFRAARGLERDRHRFRRFGPGDGISFYSPGMLGTAGNASRLAARAREELDREISVIAEALKQHGPLERDELKKLVGGRYWGPGRFRAALHAAVDEGRVRRRSRTVFAPADEEARGGTAGTGPALESTQELQHQ